jgi:hypothetical protein
MSKNGSVLWEARREQRLVPCLRRTQNILIWMTLSSVSVVNWDSTTQSLKTESAKYRIDHSSHSLISLSVREVLGHDIKATTKL